MATYPVINNKTGEQKEVVMSVMDWDKWKEDNPDWTRDYSDPSKFPSLGLEMVGDWKDRLVNRNSGWDHILKKSERAGGISGRLARRGSYESSTKSASDDQTIS
tara:strand:+ start:1042 stop:1353 length:312 start_codon:yes stop_codon:yes gene_type:complete